jgi:hypothetical protein
MDDNRNLAGSLNRWFVGETEAFAHLPINTNANSCVNWRKPASLVKTPVADYVSRHITRETQTP